MPDEVDVVELFRDGLGRPTAAACAANDVEARIDACDVVAEMLAPKHACYDVFKLQSHRRGEARRQDDAFREPVVIHGCGASARYELSGSHWGRSSAFATVSASAK